MELEGLKRALQRLTQLYKAKIEVIITDRHLMVQKYLRENWENVIHYYDVWHVAKGKSL